MKIGNPKLETALFLQAADIAAVRPATETNFSSRLY